MVAWAALDSRGVIEITAVIIIDMLLRVLVLITSVDVLLVLIIIVVLLLAVETAHCLDRAATAPARFRLRRRRLARARPMRSDVRWQAMCLSRTAVRSCRILPNWISVASVGPFRGFICTVGLVG